MCHDLKAELSNWGHLNVADIIHRAWVGVGKVMLTWGEDEVTWTDQKHLLPLLCQQTVSNNLTKPSAGFICGWEPSKATKPIKATKKTIFFPKECHHGVKYYCCCGDEHQAITWYASLVWNTSSSECAICGKKQDMVWQRG